MSKKIVPFVLKRLRQAKGLTQEELARKAKLNPQTVFRLEQEAGRQANTHDRTIQNVAQVLNTQPEVLTGEAPVPDAPVDIPGDQSRLKFATSWFAQNALYLVSKRYDMSQKNIVELAPFLFCCIAEASLQRRRERLQHAEFASEKAKVAHNELPSLSEPDFSSSDERLATEKRSIDACDLFGLLLEDHGAIAGEDRENPFARYLAQLAENTEGIAELDACAPFDWPHYRLCSEEVDALAGNDSELAEYIHDGHIALNEMPREIGGHEQTQWLRAKKEEFDRNLNPHLYDKHPDSEPSP
jgi:transcriptional regulator with XRE-family HTH domain